MKEKQLITDNQNCKCDWSHSKIDFQNFKANFYLDVTHKNDFALVLEEKRVMFIEKNCEILQEFPTAHPDVKCKINRMYKSSFPVGE